ncbi:unnamed protein product [Cyprideis torosa]|uniref:Uncharacterized protein n=1 Tax=Cyprideis torosa TaxID=163714 RepID=A0A7R8ZJA7_9CRUS|nr:unnamed protein product [Cyprideis torosa]CAG0886464.1 unnamed protein product [Cyprideis torosa]
MIKIPTFGVSVTSPFGVEEVLESHWEISRDEGEFLDCKFWSRHDGSLEAEMECDDCHSLLWDRIWPVVLVKPGDDVLLLARCRLSEPTSDGHEKESDMWVSDIWVSDIWVSDMWVSDIWVSDMWVSDIWVSDIWVSDIWVSDIWVSDMWVSDIWDGSAGNLEGLASRYADFFKTQYVDVLDLLQEFRRREWEEMRSGRSNRLPPRPQSRASTNRSSSPPPPAPSGAQSQSSSSPMTPHAQWGSSTSHSSAASPSPMHPPTNVQSDGRLQERGGPFNLPLLGPPTSSQPPCSAPSPMANNCSAAPPQHLQCDMLRGVPGGFSSRGNQSATNSPLGSPMGLPPAFVLEGGRPHPLSALYTPGKYQPSSCLSDAEEREIYGYGLPAKGKKKFFRSQGSADSGSKRLLSPDRCGLTRMCIYDAAGYEGVQASCSSRQTNGRNPGSGPFGHRGPPGYPMKKAKGHSGTGTLSRLFRTLRVQKGAGDHGRRKRPDKGEVESPDPQTLAADPLITPVPPSSIFTTNQTPSAFSFAPPTSQAPPPPDRTTTTPTSIASGDNIPSPYCNLNGPPIMAKDFVGSDPLLGSPTTDREVIGIGEAIERYKQIERQKRMQEQREQSMGLMGEQRKDQPHRPTGPPATAYARGKGAVALEFEDIKIKGVVPLQDDSLIFLPSLPPLERNSLDLPRPLSTKAIDLDSPLTSRSSLYLWPHFYRRTFEVKINSPSGMIGKQASVSRRPLRPLIFPPKRNRTAPLPALVVDLNPGSRQQGCCCLLQRERSQPLSARARNENIPAGVPIILRRMLLLRPHPPDSLHVI